MEEPEIVLNLWYVIDEGTGYAYCLLGRAYAMTGTDAEKLEKLRQLAPTDYLMAERVKVPNNFQVVLPDGKVTKGNANPADLRENMGWVYEEVYQRLEKQMPPLPKFTESETVWIKQKIPQNPLMVCTALIEDIEGNITPQIQQTTKIES